MGNISPSGRAWPWWTGTSCWSWWSVEKSHDHPHPDHQHARAVLCDRRHRVREHPGPGAKSIGLAEDPDVDNPRVRLRRIDRGDLPHRHLPPVRPVATMLLWQLILIQTITFVGLASDILGRVFTAPVAQSIHAHLIDELIEEIGKSDGPRPELETETVEVAVPFPLTQTQRERLNTIFSSNMARSVDVKEIIDGEIVAGMVVRLGNVVLDGSLKTKVKGMLAYVRESLSR